MMINDSASPNEISNNENTDDESRVVDDVLSIKVATRNAGKGIFMLSKYLESIGKTSNKIKVSDS